MWSVGEYPTKAIKREDYKHYKAIIDVLLEDVDIAENYTRKELEQELQELIAEISELSQFDKAEAEQEAHDLVEKLRKDARNLDSWRIFLPIPNLEIESPPMKIGKVELLKFEDEVYEEWLKEERRIWEENPHYPEDTAQANIEFFENRYDSLLKGETCAKVEVKRRFKRAREKGVQEIREALSVIKLYWGENDDKRRSYFGLPGDFVLCTDDSSNSLVIGRKENKNKKEFIKTGSFREFQLTQDRLAHMKEHQFDELSDILSKDKKTELEERIIASIFWFGQGIDTTFPKKDHEQAKFKADLEFFRLQERLLKFVIALEALLIVGQENKRTNIAKRGAYLLRTEKGADRIKAYKDIKKFYSTRSNIVHEGITEVTPDDVYKLLDGTRRIIFNFLPEMRSEGLESASDLKNWAKQNVETIEWDQN